MLAVVWKMVPPGRRWRYDCFSFSIFKQCRGFPPFTHPDRLLGSFVFVGKVCLYEQEGPDVLDAFQCDSGLMQPSLISPRFSAHHCPSVSTPAAQNWASVANIFHIIWTHSRLYQGQIVDQYFSCYINTSIKVYNTQKVTFRILNGFVHYSFKWLGLQRAWFGFCLHHHKHW